LRERRNKTTSIGNREEGHIVGAGVVLVVCFAWVGFRALNAIWGSVLRQSSSKADPFLSLLTHVPSSSSSSSSLSLSSELQW